MNTRVSIVCCSDYSKAKDAIRESLNLIGGLETIISPGNRVLLKPNVLSIRPPEDAVTTHPAVVAAMCELVNGYWAEEKRYLSVKKYGKYLYGFHRKIGKAPR